LIWLSGLFQRARLLKTAQSGFKCKMESIEFGH
jgi:hypothetical protein